MRLLDSALANRDTEPSTATHQTRNSLANRTASLDLLHPRRLNPRAPVPTCLHLMRRPSREITRFRARRHGGSILIDFVAGGTRAGLWALPTDHIDGVYGMLYIKFPPAVYECGAYSFAHDTFLIYLPTTACAVEP
jgi:hypothetical protein